jgi:hypothetical protein
MIAQRSQRYCWSCGARFLLPESFEDYLALAPAHTHLERDLPHYDLVAVNA